MYINSYKQYKEMNTTNQKKHKTKIGHSLQQLQDGLILTLQDKSVLVNGQINEQDDVFENYEKRIINQAQHNKELKQKLKIISNAATSHLQAKNQGMKGLLPHYDDYRYKSDQIDIEDGTVTKRSRPKINKNIPSDFQNTNNASNNINTEYYDSNKKFKQRKKQKTNTADLLNFLNETAIQKQIKDQPINTNAIDVIQQSLNNVRKRIKLQNQINGNIKQGQRQNILGQDEQLLAKAIKIGRQKNQQKIKLLDIIKQQNEEEPNNSSNNNNIKQQNKQKYTQIQLNPVTSRPTTQNKETKKTYNITDAAKGTTSCLYVNLPSQKIVIKKQQQNMPTSFKDISPQQLQKMKQQVAFLEQRSMGTGLAGTLQYLRDNNLLNNQQQFGRTNDEESHHNKPGDRIKLQYRNASGKLMKPKQAFRYLSAIFHGQGPSKNKVQKIKKKQILQMRIKQAASGPSKMMSLLEKHQGKTGEAHMVIQLGAKNKQPQ